MARILLTWELGGGLGHLLNLRPLAAELTARGHEVSLAVRELAQVDRLFQGLSVRWFAAPWKSHLANLIDPVITYADLLLNIGFSDVGSLTGHVRAWQDLYTAIQPDLVVCDHSPTALLALRGLGIPTATVGTGFFCPVDEPVLRPLRTATEPSLRAARVRERQLLDNINHVLKRNGNSTIQRVLEVYHAEGIRHFLVTYPELDHFPGRQGGDYRGPLITPLSGDPLPWPGEDRRVFVYLKPFPALQEFVQLLANSNIHAVIYIDGPSQQSNRPVSTRLRFVDRPVNIQRAAQECDAAVTNANPTTCAAILLAGKPLVNVPIYLEQALFAASVERLGAGITARGDDARAILDGLNRVLTDGVYRQAAAQFANRHSADQVSRVASRIVDELEQRW